MEWFNYYGLIIISIIMIPNIIYAITHKNDFINNYNNKVAIVLEQIGRYGCMVFMIFNIPYTYFNFWFKDALVAYLSVNGILCFLYILFWIICWSKNNKLKALTLSILPSIIFIFSSIVLANIPLIIFSIRFSINHILISYKNAKSN